MMRRLAGSRVLRLFSASVIDHALMSAASLGLALLLIRQAGPEQYGYFVLVQVAILLLASVEGSWIGGPLMVLAPKRTVPERDRMIAIADRGLNRSLLRLLPLALITLLITFVAGWCSNETAGLAAAGILATWQSLRRNFARRVLLIRALPTTLLATDAIYSVGLLGGAAVAVLLPGPVAVWTVLGLSLAAFASTVYARRALAFPSSTAASSDGAVWREMRPVGMWATVGSTIHWVQSQSFNYTLAVVLTVSAVAHVNEVRLMLMPLVLMCIGVSSQLTPMAARWLHDEGLPSLMRRLWKFIAVLLVLDLVYVAVLWLSRDWVTSTLMNTVIPDRDLLILLWTGHALLAVSREMLQAALLVLVRFRALAGLSALAAVMALGTMWFCVDRYGAVGAVMGTASGELFFLIGMAFLLPQSLRRDRAHRAALAPLAGNGT